MTRSSPPLLVGALVLAVFLGPRLESTASANDLPTGFDDAWDATCTSFTRLLEAEGIVGGSLMFLHDDHTETKFYGLADQETGRRVDVDTIYHWASITKTLTAIGILQMRDRGLLDLDNSVLETCPEIGSVHNPFGAMEDITLRHVLTHSAGFRNSTWPWGGDEPWHPHEPKTWSQLVAMMPYTKIHFEPGSRFSYSNPAIIFLGRTLEALSGDDYEVYVDKNIFKPLGMTRSYFDGTPYHLLEDRSNNYYVEGEKLKTNGLDFDTGVTVSNGGFNAPLPDMARYLRFLLGAESSVLARSSLDEMWDPALPIGKDGPIESSIGLTYFLLDHGGQRYIGHTGGQMGFISFFYIHPPTRTACLAAFNTLGRSKEGKPRPDTRSVLATLRLQFFESVFPLFRES